MSKNSDVYEKFIHYDKLLQELTKKCTDARIKRQKYQNKLINQSDIYLEQNGLKRVYYKYYQPISQKFLQQCFQSFFQKEDSANKCMSYILQRREKYNKPIIKIHKKEE